MADFLENSTESLLGSINIDDQGGTILNYIDTDDTASTANTSPLHAPNTTEVVNGDATTEVVVAIDDDIKDAIETETKGDNAADLLLLSTEVLPLCTSTSNSTTTTVAVTNSNDALMLEPFTTSHENPDDNDIANTTTDAIHVDSDAVTRGGEEHEEEEAESTQSEKAPLISPLAEEADINQLIGDGENPPSADLEKSANNESAEVNVNTAPPPANKTADCKGTAEAARAPNADAKPAVAARGSVQGIGAGEDSSEAGSSCGTPGRAEYRLQFNATENGLVSVPEHDLLTQVDPVQVQPSAFTLQGAVPDSKDSDGTSETHSESNSTTVSSKHGGHYLPVGKTEPLTAKQQVALWLTRTSTQDLNNEFSMSSLRSLVMPSSISNKHPKKKRLTSDRCEKEEMRRNSSTKSLMDKYSVSREPGFEYSPIRKCETVLALSDSRQFNRGYEVYSPSNGRRHFQHSQHHRRHHQHQHQASCQSSNTSLFKRLSKTGSDVFSCKQLRCGRTAPGELSSAATAASIAASVGGGAGGSCHQPPDTPTSGVVPLRPVNRLRSQSSLLQCSRCTSVLSVNSRATSQMSLLLDKRNNRLSSVDDVMCKICLVDYTKPAMVKLDDCGCLFCKECMSQYIRFEVMEGAYDIACPDQECPAQGVLNQRQMELLTSKELMDKHRTFRLNTEVSLDASRTFCPAAGCDTICHICVGNKSQGGPVSCPTCDIVFCSMCSATWHPGLSCAENGALLVARGGAGGGGGAGSQVDDGGLFWACSDEIKKCPMCYVPIERDAGCAQMMCKRCKHVFCWYCLTSLDDDFLLRHYDSGECKGKLGHSRASVIWHRAQVIGIFAGFGILLLVASPLLIVAAPCVLCCKCRNCSKSLELNSESSFSKVSKSPS